MLNRWARAIHTIVFCAAVLILSFMGNQSAIAQTTQPYLPTAAYQGADVPDWNNLSFSTFPVMTDSGTLVVPSNLVNQLQYDPSRRWQAGDALASVLMLGDVQDAFGLQTLTLEQIAQKTGLNLSQIALSNFKLLGAQTISSLLDAVPGLEKLQVSQVKPIADLLRLNQLPDSWRSQININDWGTATISQIVTIPEIGALQIGALPLDRYSLTDVPGLANATIDKFKDWQSSLLSDVPGLDQLTFANFPASPAQQNYLGYIALHDVTYGPKEHRTTPTRRSITGSDVVGFHYQCAQERGCAYLELNSPISLGIAGDPTGLHGAQWIKGGTSPGGQMVKGGHGILGALNGGMEPTGRLPFGKVFKVVLTNTTESEGSGQFGLFFRVCHHGAIDLGCTPYFIGPVPFLSTHEKGIVFVGLTEGTPPDVQAPDTPKDVQDVIDQYDGGSSSLGGNSQLCGSGPGGVDWNALSTAIAGIESQGSGDYAAVGEVNCDRQGCMVPMGRYQFMSFRDDARATISKRPGGSAFLARMDAGYRPSQAELLQYFPPADQDALFKQAMSDEIRYQMRRGVTGTNLIQCLGEAWYHGTCDHSSQRDYIGGPTTLEYGQHTRAAYEQALKRSGAKVCTQSGGGNGKPGVATGKMIPPIDNATITGRFGDDRDTYIHKGVDFAAPMGTPIKAADGGVVKDACMGCDPGGYGSLILIEHKDGTETVYAHPSRINVKIGERVAQGQVIGAVGSEGRSTGPHLHFEVRQNGVKVDPLPYIRSKR